MPHLDFRVCHNPGLCESMLWLDRTLGLSSLGSRVCVLCVQKEKVNICDPLADCGIIIFHKYFLPLPVRELKFSTHWHQICTCDLLYPMKCHLQAESLSNIMLFCHGCLFSSMKVICPRKGLLLQHNSNVICNMSKKWIFVAVSHEDLGIICYCSIT